MAESLNKDHPLTEPRIRSLSVVVPIYNEAANIQPLMEELLEVLEGGGSKYEIILVDDGSTDRSYPLLEEQAARNPAVRVIRFRRNFGQTAAMAAGFDAASGDVIIPMDADLQNDPRDIPRLLEQIEQGYDVVSGWRMERQDRFLSRRLPSQLANRLISGITGVRLHDYGCTLKAYRREVVQEVALYGELHRFIPALAGQVGARVTEVAVNHRARRAGESKYGIDRTLRVVMDLITVRLLSRYARKPMHLFGKIGAWAILLGILSGVLTLYMKWFEDLSMNRNPLLLLTAFLVFAGLQFFATGFMAELMMRTYHESQGKPIYVVRETLNFDATPEATADSQG